MKNGHLSQYFEAVVGKHLSAVEVDMERSHQHEFNGVRALVDMLGEAGAEKVKIPTRILYVNGLGIVTKEGEEVSFTWYDARARHATRSEHRLYFPHTEVFKKAMLGDLFILCKRRDGGLTAILVEGGTTMEQQVKWWFGLHIENGGDFEISKEGVLDGIGADFTLNSFLDDLGIAVAPTTDDGLDLMIATFGEAFPMTTTFSDFARAQAGDITSSEDPDTAITLWMEKEEQLYRLFENHLLKDKIKEFESVDQFIAFSLSVHNKRKSRAGHAFQNHLGKVFEESGITCSRDNVTENGKTPDFMFPSIERYHDKNFPTAKLTMLGAKTTCKDRWRQVLSEANRIEHKHLVTLEPAISTNQTNGMIASKLQLVVPRKVLPSYTLAQREWLMDLKSFVSHVRRNQS